MFKAQRVAPQDAAERVAACEVEGANRIGRVGFEGRVLGRWKNFRLGALKGGGRNLVFSVKNDLRKSEVPNNLISRGGGVRQGGVRVTVSLVLCFSLRA